MFMWLVFALVLGVGFLGFANARPVSGVGDPSARTRTAESEDPIDALKQRYVNGEIDIEAFERRAKRLYETDQGESLREPSGTAPPGGDPSRADSSTERANGNRSARRPNRRGHGGCRR